MPEVDDNIRQLIHDRASEQELTQHARERSLLPGGRQKGVSATQLTSDAVSLGTGVTAKACRKINGFEVATFETQR